MSYSDEHRRERCDAMHAAIRAGRTALEPVSVAVAGAQTVRIYSCPICKTPITRLLVGNKVAA